MNITFLDVIGPEEELMRALGNGGSILGVCAAVAAVVIVAVAVVLIVKKAKKN